MPQKTQNGGDWATKKIEKKIEKKINISFLIDFHFCLNGKL